MHWRTLGLLILGSVMGCHAPPAIVAGCDPDAPGKSRCQVLIRQVAADTALNVAQNPVRAAGVVVCESADGLAADSRGAIGKRLLMHLHPCPGPIDPNRPTLDSLELENCLCRLTDEPLQPAGVHLLTTGADALAGVLKVIDQATCRLDVIMFMWDNSVVGQTIAQHLAAKASSNVPVRVLLDGGGNVIFGEPLDASAAVANRAVCWLAHQPCVQVIRVRNSCTRFDHRKLVVADGQVAWTGGRNFTDEGFFKRHDVSMVVTGPLVASMARRFETFWRDQGGAPGSELVASPCLSPNASGRLVYTAPGDHVFEHVVYAALDRACHHVYIENPYLTDAGIVTKLARARRAGADVRVVLSIVTDTPSINHASRVTANRLLSAGVRVYLYPGWTHVKAATVDGCWAYLGTGNFDSRSLRKNHEIGLSISGGPLIGEIEQVVMYPDFRPEWELKAPLTVTPADLYFEFLTAWLL